MGVHITGRRVSYSSPSLHMHWGLLLGVGPTLAQALHGATFAITAIERANDASPLSPALAPIPQLAEEGGPPPYDRFGGRMLVRSQLKQTRIRDLDSSSISIVREPRFKLYSDWIRSSSQGNWTSRIRQWKHHRAHPGDSGVKPFFTSVDGFEWIIFFIVLVSFLLLHWCLIDWPSKRKYHSLALIIWLCAAAVYNLVLWDRLGHTVGQMWMTGYFLEFVFSIENVFIYHIVVESFEVPRRQAQKALFVVVCCQMVFQMVFFMGLAGWLQSIVVLPYVLGPWLIYVAVETVRESDHNSFNVRESAVFRVCRACLGSHLEPVYRKDGSIFFMESGGIRVTMLFPAIACLLLVDFVMEVDVTLTKIEAIPNHYIGFTSSAAAAFAVPELFFVARDLFQRFYLLKYGVGFVLFFFGSELLMHRLLDIPDMVGILIIVLVLILCIVLSDVFPKHSAGVNTEDESELDQQEIDRRVPKVST